MRKFLEDKQEHNQRTFETRVDGHIQELTDSLQKTCQRLQEDVDHLDSDGATKAALQGLRNEMNASADKLEATLTTTQRDLKQTDMDFRVLEAAAKHFSTQEQTQVVARKFALEAAAECDEKQEILQLTREVDEERERLRQLTRQEQHSRSDLNDTMGEVHDLRAKNNELRKCCDSLREHLEHVDTRGATDAHLAQTAVAKQEQSVLGIEALCRSMRDEFTSHIETQRTVQENLAQRSTQRYLEQIDKALTLNGKLEKMEVDQAGLHETVQAIKLPVLSVS